MGYPQLLFVMAARVGELGARVLWGYGFEVLLTIDEWLLFIWHGPLLLVIGYWLCISTIGY